MLTPRPCQSARVIGRDLGHPLPPGVGDAGERPRVVLRRVEAERPLLAFRFDFFPQRQRPVGPFAGRLGVEAVAQLRRQLARRSSPAGRGTGGASAARACPGRSSTRTSSARSWPGARRAASRRAGSSAPARRGSCRPSRSGGGRRRCTPAWPPIAAVDAAVIVAHVGHRPDAMDDAQVVGRLERRLPDDRLLRECSALRSPIGVQAEDLAEVRLAGVPQLAAGPPWRRCGFLRAGRCCPRRTARAARGT